MAASQQQAGAAVPAQNGIPRLGTGVGEMSSSNTAESSKFKRFLRRFGRRASDEGSVGGTTSHDDASGNLTNGHGGVDRALSPDATAPDSSTASPVLGGKKSPSMRQRKRSSSGPKASKRSDSLLSGRFFHSNSNAPPMPTGTKQGDAVKASQNKPLPPVASEGSVSPNFGGTDVGALADSLTMPKGSQAPQLGGVPAHEPLAPSEVVPMAPQEQDKMTGADPVGQHGGSVPHGQKDSLEKSTMKQVSTAAAPGALASQLGVANVVQPADEASPNNSYLSQQDGTQGLSDYESELRRDSADNATVETTKSRASTKPTTLMSLDTRENIQGSIYAPIAQAANGNGNDAQSRNTGTRASDGVTSSGVQFAEMPHMVQSANDTPDAIPGQADRPHEVSYSNVPSISRPHPANNPAPSGIPADNASVLTLASSTAAASILGGAASSRGNSHAAPSMGGARSIGGSYMGERRNSSDTYASVKALPPLSRRGSDASQRTSRSIAASATGQNSHQAMMHPAGIAATTGPGAPHDRISIHRTASQRTIATQLSIPLSTSNQALGAAGHPVQVSDEQQAAEAGVQGGAKQSMPSLLNSDASSANGIAHAPASIASTEETSPIVTKTVIPTQA